MTDVMGALAANAIRIVIVVVFFLLIGVHLWSRARRNRSFEQVRLEALAEVIVSGYIVQAMWMPKRRLLELSDQSGRWVYIDSASNGLACRQGSHASDLEIAARDRAALAKVHDAIRGLGYDQLPNLLRAAVIDPRIELKEENGTLTIRAVLK